MKPFLMTPRSMRSLLTFILKRIVRKQCSWPAATKFKWQLKDCLVKLITELEVKLTGRMDNIDKKLAEFTDSIEGLKSSVSKVEGEVEEVKSSVEFQGSEIDELKKTAVSKVDYEKMKDALSRRIEELEKQMVYNETRSRKYNLLFYGVPKEEEEDIVEVVRKLIVTELKFTQSYAKDVAIANAHRIPKTPETRPMPS